jgi:hypothetical protein
VTVEGLSLIGSVRVVIAGIAIATCQCPATASKLESDTVVCLGNQPAVSIQNGDWNHPCILAIGMRAFPVGCKSDSGGRVRGFQLTGTKSAFPGELRSGLMHLV